MDGLEPITDDVTLPDVFVRGYPMRITQALTFFRLQHLQDWDAPIALHPWDTWDQLADRLGARLGHHLWHPVHWDQYYANLPDTPASTPGAIPLTRRVAKALTRDLFSANLREDDDG